MTDKHTHPDPDAPQDQPAHDKNDLQVTQKLDVPGTILAKWQKIVDLLARTIGVPAGLIMRVHPDEIEVFVASDTADNPYVAGAKEHLNTGLYCETVMEQRGSLLVPNALEDPDWDDNPDLALNMVSYLGFPLIWPDDQVFGTVCVLDNKTNAYSSDYIALVQQFSEIINDDLKLLSERARRQQAEAQLNERNKLFKLEFDGSPDAITITRLSDGLYLDVNGAFSDIMGYQPQDVIGKTSLDLNIWLHAEDRQKLVESLMRDELVDDQETEFRRQDGEIVIGSLSARVLSYDGEHVILSTMRDITQRKHVEQVLRDSEQQLRWLVQNMPVLIDAFDADGHLVMWNAECERVTGYSSDEIVGNPNAIEMLYPDPAYRQYVLQDALQLGDQLKDQEYTLTCKDGLPKTIRWSHIPAPYTVTGQLTWAVGIDVTEQRQAEKLLRASEEKYRLLVEHSHQGMVIAQANPIRLSFVSQPMQAIVGYTPQEMMQLTPDGLSQLIHPEDRDRFFGAFVTRLAGQDLDPRGRYRIIHKTGETRHVDLYSVRIEYRGEPAVQTVFLDVTDHVEAERLKVRFHKEQEQNVLVQRVVSMLSHDLRTPLAIIASSRDILYRYFDRLSDQAREEKLNSIERQVHFATELLEDAVNTVRGPINNREFMPQPINLAMLCQISVDEIHSAQDGKHDMQFVNSGAVETVSVDEVLVSRILVNLLSNAIKYSSPGSRIQLLLDRNDEWIVLQVADQGIGISSEDLPQIFRPFFRSEAVTEITGTGLGLGIVKDCVDRHQGRIHVESQPGQGSIFTVELPIITTA
jgi:PAS domain S-box-containing protein